MRLHLKLMKGPKNSKAQDDVLFKDGVNKEENELEELENLMEAELKMGKSSTVRRTQAYKTSSLNSHEI